MDTPARTASFELARHDYQAMSRHVYKSGAGNWSGLRLALPVAFLIGAFVVRRFGRDGQVFGMGALVAFMVMLTWLSIAMLRLRPRLGGAWLCHYDVQLTDAGVRLQTPHWTCDLPWHGVLAVEETSAHCFLRIDTASMYVIPKRAFANDGALQQFIGFAREGVARARAARSTSA